MPNDEKKIYFEEFRSSFEKPDGVDFNDIQKKAKARKNACKQAEDDLRCKLHYFEKGTALALAVVALCKDRLGLKLWAIPIFFSAFATESVVRGTADYVIMPGLQQRASRQKRLSQLWAYVENESTSFESRQLNGESLNTKPFKRRVKNICAETYMNTVDPMEDNLDDEVKGNYFIDP